MRSHSTKNKSTKNKEDTIHDEVHEFLQDVGGFIAPLIPEGMKWTLFIDPGEDHLKYWTGDMDAATFENMLMARLETEMGRIDPRWMEWFKAGPPREQL